MPGQRFHLAHKMTAIFVSISFVLCETFSYGAPLPAPAEFPRLQEPALLPSQLPALPETLGKIQSLLETGSDKTVVLIQDAHGQTAAQESTDKILSYLRENTGLDAVFLEGGLRGRIAPDLLRFTKDEALNASIAGKLMRRGVIGGPDYYLLKNPGIPAFGTESGSHYGQDVLTFRKIYSRRKGISRFLEGVKKELLKNSARISNPDLKEFTREWLTFQDSRRDWMAHMDFLDKRAQKFLALDFHDPRLQLEYPQLVRFFKIRDLEPEFAAEGFAKELDREKKEWAAWTEKNRAGGSEAAEIREWINGRRREAPKELRRLLEAFSGEARTRGFEWQAFPRLNRFFAHAILSQEIDASGLFAELRGVTSALRDKLTRTPEEKNLMRLFENYLMLKKLFDLEWTRRDYEDRRGNFAPFKPSALLEELAALDPESRKRKPLQAADATFEEALLFYDLALKREEIMVESMLAAMDREGIRRAAFVAGGFHADGVAELLKRRQVSYWNVMPHMNTLEPPANYLAQMTLGNYKDRDKSAVSSPNPARIPVPAMRYVISAADRDFVGRQILAVLAETSDGKRFERGPAYEMQFPERSEKQAPAKRSEMRLSPWAQELPGYSMARLMTLIEYLPRRKFPSSDYETKAVDDGGKASFEGLLAMINSRERRPVARNLEGVPVKSIQTLAQNQAPPSQAIHELTKNGSDWSISRTGRESMPSSRHGHGSKQLLGQLTGPGEYAVIETRTAVGRGVRVVLWNLGSEEAPDYQIYYELADDIKLQGTKISVFKKLSDEAQDELRNLIREKMKINAGAAVRVEDERANRPEAFSYSGPEEGGQIREDLTEVDVTVTADGYVVQDYGKGMDLKTLLESFFNLNNSAGGADRKTPERNPKDTKLFSKPELSRSARVEISINGHLVQGESYDRLNVVSNMVLDLPYGTPAPISWDVVDFDAKAIAAVMDVIERVTRPDSADPQQFAVINTLALLIQSISGNQNAVKALLSKLKSRTRELIQAKRDAGQQIIPVPNLVRQEKTSHGWTPFDSPEFVPLDPGLIDFYFPDVEPLLSAPDLTITEPVRAAHPSLQDVPIHVAKWDLRASAKTAVCWVLVGGRPVILLDEKVYLKTAARNPAILQDLLAETAKNLPSPSEEPAAPAPEVKEKETSALLEFVRKYFRWIIGAAAVLALAVTLFVVRPSFEGPDEKTAPQPDIAKVEPGRDKTAVKDRAEVKDKTEIRDKGEVKDKKIEPKTDGDDELAKLTVKIQAEFNGRMVSLNDDFRQLITKERKFLTDFVDPVQAGKKPSITAEEASKLNNEITRLRKAWAGKYEEESKWLKNPDYRAPVLLRRHFTQFAELGMEFNTQQSRAEVWALYKEKKEGKDEWVLEPGARRVDSGVRVDASADFVHRYHDVRDRMVDLRQLIGDMERDLKVLDNPKAETSQKMILRAYYLQVDIQRTLAAEASRLKGVSAAEPQKIEFSRLEGEFDELRGRFRYDPEKGEVKFHFGVGPLEPVKAIIPQPAVVLRGQMEQILVDQGRLANEIKDKRFVPRNVPERLKQLENTKGEWKRAFEEEVQKNDPAARPKLQALARDFNAAMEKAGKLDEKGNRLEDPDSRVEVPPDLAPEPESGSSWLRFLPGWLITLISIAGGILMVISLLRVVLWLVYGAPPEERNRVGSASPFKKKGRNRSGPVEPGGSSGPLADPESAVYGGVTDPKLGEFNGMSPIHDGFYFPISETGDWVKIDKVVKTARGGGATIRKPAYIHYSGDAEKGQEIPLLNYPNGVIEDIDIKVIRIDGGAREVTSAWQRQGEKIVFLEEGNFEISYAVKFYNPQDIRWEFFVDPLTALLPPNELADLEEYFTEEFKGVSGQIFSARLAAVEGWMARHLYYNHSDDKTNELDFDPARHQSWTEALHEMTEDGKKCGVICNTAALVKILLLAQVDIRAVYMTMVIPDAKGTLTRKQDGHAAQLVRKEDPFAVYWEYSEATADLGSAPVSRQLRNPGEWLRRLNPLVIFPFLWTFMRITLRVMLGKTMDFLQYLYNGMTISGSLQAGRALLNVLAVLFVGLSIFWVPAMVAGSMIGAVIFWFLAPPLLIALVFTIAMAAVFARSKGQPVFQSILRHVGLPGYDLVRSHFRHRKNKQLLTEAYIRLGMPALEARDSANVYASSLHARNTGAKTGLGRILHEFHPDNEPLVPHFLYDPAFWAEIEKWRGLYDYFTAHPNDEFNDLGRYMKLISAARDSEGRVWLHEQFTVIGEADIWAPRGDGYAEEWQPSQVFLRSSRLLRSEVRGAAGTALVLGDALLQKSISEGRLDNAVRVMRFANKIAEMEIPFPQATAIRLLQLAWHDMDIAVRLVDYLEESVYRDFSEDIPRIQDVNAGPAVEVYKDSFFLSVAFDDENFSNVTIRRRHTFDNKWEYEVASYISNPEGPAGAIMPGKIAAVELEGNAPFTISFEAQGAGMLLIFPEEPERTGKPHRVKHVIDPYADLRIVAFLNQGVQESRVSMLKGFAARAPDIQRYFDGRMRIWTDWVIFGGGLEFEKDEAIQGPVKTGSVIDGEFAAAFDGRVSLGWLVDAAKKNMSDYDSGLYDRIEVERIKELILEAKEDNEKPRSELEMLSSISAQDRTRMLMIRELIQNARDAIRALPPGERAGMQIRVRSYLVRDGDRVRWVVSVRDPVGMKNSLFFFKFWPPRVSTKAPKEALKEILKNRQGPDSQAVEIIKTMMAEDARDDLDLRTAIVTRIQAGGDLEKLADDLLRRHGARLARTRAAGRFGIGKDTVYADADEVVVRSGAEGKVYDTRVKVDHADMDDLQKVTGLEARAYDEYSDPENAYKGTSVQRYKDVSDVTEARLMDVQLKYLFAEFVGAVDDVDIVFEDQDGKPLDVPVRDTVTPLATHGVEFPVTVGKSGMGIRRLTVDKLLVEDKRNQRLYAFVPEWAQKWMDDNALGLDFVRGTPVTESRTSLLKAGKHAPSTAAAVLKSAAKAYREGWVTIPGLPSYAEFLKSPSFERLKPEPALLEHAALISSGGEIPPAAWKKYKEDQAAYVLLLLHVATPRDGLPARSLADEKKELFFSLLPEWVRSAFFQNAALRAAVLDLAPRLTADPVSQPELFSKQAAITLLLALARLYVTEKVMVPGLAKFSEYVRIDHSAIGASQVLKMQGEAAVQGDFSGIDFAELAAEPASLIALLLSMPLENGKSINAIKEEILSSAAATAVAEAGSEVSFNSSVAALKLTSRLEVKSQDDKTLAVFAQFLDSVFTVLEAGLTEEQKGFFNYERIDWNFSENSWELAAMFQKFLEGDRAAEQQILQKLLSRISADAQSAGLAYYNALLMGDFDPVSVQTTGRDADAAGFRSRYEDRLTGGHLHYEYERGGPRSELRSLRAPGPAVSLDVQVEVAVYAAEKIIRMEARSEVRAPLWQKLWSGEKTASPEELARFELAGAAFRQSTRPVSAVSVVPADLGPDEMERYVEGVLPVLNQETLTHEIVVMVEEAGMPAFKRLFEKTFNRLAAKYRVPEPQKKLLQIHVVDEKKFAAMGDVLLGGREVMLVAPRAFRSELLDQRASLARLVSDRQIDQSAISRNGQRSLLGAFITAGFQTLLYQPKDLDQEQFMALGQDQAWYLRSEALLADFNTFITGLLQQTKWVEQSA